MFGCVQCLHIYYALEWKLIYCDYVGLVRLQEHVTRKCTTI